MEQRTREQRLGARHGLDRRLTVVNHLVLGDPLDQYRKATAPGHELRAVLEADASPAAGLVLLVLDLDDDSRQLAEVQVPAPLGEWAGGARAAPFTRASSWEIQRARWCELGFLVGRCASSS